MRPYLKLPRANLILPLGICLFCFCALVIIVAFLGIRYQDTTKLDPYPNSPQDISDQGFPLVDWDYWKQVNPHVIGWITIPNTKVDYPIVQAQKSDPEHYLNHDVFGNWNYMGCPYLDAECAELGLEKSLNVVVFAHNLGYGDDSMFAAIARYIEIGFAKKHRIILVQTPTSRMKFLAQGAACLHGSTDSKRTTFDGNHDFWNWFDARLSECQVVIDPSKKQPQQVLTLCTCSYNRWDDERTLLFATL